MHETRLGSEDRLRLGIFMTKQANFIATVPAEHAHVIVTTVWYRASSLEFAILSVLL
jgi:hypothetical protein